MNRFATFPRRIAELVILLFGISLVTFFLLRLIPGDPALAILGSSYTKPVPSRSTPSLGLNKPIWTQYGLYMGHLFHGNLGFSFFYNQPATTVIVNHIRADAVPGDLRAVMAAVISLPLGFSSGLHRGGAMDQGSRVFFTTQLRDAGLLARDHPAA